jgi:hypothetical protein
MVVTNEIALRGFLSLNPTAAIDVVLDEALALGLDPREQYTRKGDAFSAHKLEINVSENLDVRIGLGDIDEVLFCPQGRGQSPMVRNALAILAYAIKKSNKERPQK